MVIGLVDSKMNYGVELINISKNFPNSQNKQILAVDHLNLQINEGEFFSLLGPSGCGKTTVLRIIGGFEIPTTGEVYIQEKVMTHRPAFERPVNTVFQNYALFPHLNVVNNIAFGLKMEKIPPLEIKIRVADMIKLVKLEGLENRYPHQLSGGQQQRVALARSLVKRPKVLLLDEPLGALDLKLKKEMQLELKQTQQQIGITFVYVTHDQEEALALSDRIAVMNEGKILQIGSAMEIYEEPKNRFVADFIGETNTLTGRIIEKNQEKIVVLIDDKIPLNVISYQEDINLGQMVTLLIRPEKGVLYPAEYKLPSALMGVIEEVIYLGTDTRYLIRITRKSRLVIRKQNLNPSLISQFNAGQNVKISISPDTIRLLKET
jgi:spermidine/putrescine transport system ATP-binding protein